MEKTILFVDDEKAILRALRRLFYNSKYRVFIADSGADALEILNTQNVDMMITDMRMPEMDGYELLQRVKEAYPHILRIALSGYTDKDIVLSALKRNLAKVYLFKPWDNDDFIALINGLFNFEAVLRDENLLDLVGNLSDLPTIPELYKKVSDLVEAEASIENIVRCINDDQAITARILRIANSAYFGSKTGDIKQAILFIGLVNVNNIILSNSVFNFEGSNKQMLEDEWRHSSMTNRLLNYLYSKVMKHQLPNDHKSAGLLHNIGKVVLINEYTAFYLERKAAGKLEATLVQDELDVIGVSHPMISGYLLHWWELPLPIVESVMFHHDPMKKDIINKELVMAVHVAQYYASIACGLEPEGELYLDALVKLGISRETMEAVMTEIKG